MQKPKKRKTKAQIIESILRKLEKKQHELAERKIYQLKGVR